VIAFSQFGLFVAAYTTGICSILHAVSPAERRRTDPVRDGKIKAFCQIVLSPLGSGISVAGNTPESGGILPPNK
jgi:hypothetical protein